MPSTKSKQVTLSFQKGKHEDILSFFSGMSPSEIRGVILYLLRKEIQKSGAQQSLVSTLEVTEEAVIKQNSQSPQQNKGRKKKQGRGNTNQMIEPSRPLPPGIGDSDFPDELGEFS